MDQALENLIDEAGRDHVFDRVREAGWTPADSIPKWVWQEAAWGIIKDRQDKADATQYGLGSLFTTARE